jgi:hypothetical protein
MRFGIRESRTACLIFFLLTVAWGATAETDLSVFGDSFQNGFRDSHWVSLNVGNTTLVHSGACSISVSPVASWQGIYFRHPGFDTTPYSSLSFWVHGGTNGGQRLQVQALLGNANPPQDVYYRFTAPTGAWQQVTIPLAALGVSRKTNCSGFWIELTPSGSSNTFYVDDVQFNSSAAAVSPASDATTAATAAPVKAVETGWRVADWCMVGALALLFALLAWLIVMLRRSGLGASKALVPVSAACLPEPGVQADDPSEIIAKILPSEADGTLDPQVRRIRERVALELAEFAKHSLVQGLYSQRGKLMETQQKAEEELAALEARLAMLQLPMQERIRAYELRIGELEKQLNTRDQEMRGMIEATLLLVQQRLEEEKSRQNAGTRLN